MRLEVKNLAYIRGRFRLDVGLNLPSGHLGVVLGPSGCGKSTLLRLIAGLVTPDSGRISLGDREIAGMPPEKRNIGFVFQDFALFPHLTAGKNIEYGPRRHGMEAKEVTRVCLELAKAFHIVDLLDRKPQQLSGGEQQRVALARALAFRPDLILMDEPLCSLDEVLRKDLRMVIRERLKEVGVTTLYVTHDIGEAMVIADSLFVMHEGHIRHTGEPSELVRYPPDEDLVRFMSLGPTIPLLRTKDDAGWERGEIPAAAEAGSFLCRGGSGEGREYSDGKEFHDDSDRERPRSEKVLYFPRWAAVPIPAPRSSSSPLGSPNTFRAIVLTSSPEGRWVRLGIRILPPIGKQSLKGPENSFPRWTLSELEVDADGAPRPGEIAFFSVNPEMCRLIPAARVLV